jgi:sterol desaturase/sphingolipid hydroxylase (fatty acid hydroxylase superfamily)
MERPANHWHDNIAGAVPLPGNPAMSRPDAPYPQPENGVRRAVVGLAIVNAVGLSALLVIRPEFVGDMIDGVHGAMTQPRWDTLWSYGQVFAAVLIVEFVALGWHRSSIAHYVRFSKSTRTDLAVLLLRLLGWHLAIEIFSSGGFGDFAAVLGHDLVGLVPPFGLHGIAQVIAFFVLLDFVDYWAHRWSHELDALWQAHKFHHAATDFTIATGSRVHALDHITRDVGVAMVVVFVGAPVIASIVAIRLVRQVIDMFQHSRVDWTYGWIGRWVIYSPVGHRIHHSIEPEHWDLNYGNISPIWDRLFGTWYAGDRVNTDVDVTSNWYNQRGVVADYLLTYTAVFDSLVCSISSRRFRTVADDSPLPAEQSGDIATAS